MKGLIHFCGKIDPESSSHLVCSVGLQLLNVFFDYSTCPGRKLIQNDKLLDAELFINLLGSLPLKYINLLYLNHHIEGKSQKQCKSPALKITELYLNRNPSLQPKDIVILWGISLILQLTMEAALKEFEKWRQTKINNSKKAECFEITEEMTHSKSLTIRLDSSRLPRI